MGLDKIDTHLKTVTLQQMQRSSQNKETLLLIAILISMCIWGMSWSSAKVLSGYASPTTLAFIRFFFVPFTLFPIIKFFNIDIKIKKQGYKYVIGAGIFMLIYTLVFFKGLKEGEPGKAGVLVTTTNPIFAYIIGLIISRVLPNKRELIGLGIGVIAGIILLNVFTEPNAILAAGNSYFLIGAFVWAVMSKFSSHANKFGSPIAFSFWMNLITVIGLGFLADVEDVTYIITTGDKKFWLNILYFGIINSSLATTCYLFATAKIGAEKASTYIFIVPSMAIIGSWLFMDEEIKLHTVIGGLIGIVAVFIINGKLRFKK